jgi:AcrR family transcriptional regulator
MQPYLRRTIIVHTRLSFPGESMLELRQSAGIRDATITAFLRVLPQEGSREPGVSHAPGKAEASESAFDEHFQSKEDSVSAYLKERHVIWMRWFKSEIEARYEATGGGLEIIADVLQMGFQDPKCLGCAFLNIVTEGGNFNSEPFAIAREQKEHLRQFIEQLAVRMDLQHPDMAASAAVLVIERTIVRTLMTGSLREAQTARLLFECLQHA